MAKVTRKDVEAFARVAKELGRIAEMDPDAIMDILEDFPAGVTSHEAKLSTKKEFSPRVQDADLYAFAKENTEQQLIEYLRSFSAEELKECIKKYSLGYTKLKAVDSISEYIAEQLKKRTVDVFMRHEK